MTELRQEIEAVNAALPSKSYEKIVSRINEDWANYSFVYRTMNLGFKRLKWKHSLVLKEAKAIINETHKAIK